MQETINVKGIGEIGDLKGVESASVDMASGKAIVKFNPKEVNHGAIKSKITARGYSTG